MVYPVCLIVLMRLQTFVYFMMFLSDIAAVALTIIIQFADTNSSVYLTVIGAVGLQSSLLVIFKHSSTLR